MRYTDKKLGAANFEEATAQVLVSVKKKHMKINSSTESIDKFLIYDLLGKQIYKKTNAATKELVILKLGLREQALIVKTVLQNGQTVANKIIF